MEGKSVEIIKSQTWYSTFTNDWGEPIKADEETIVKVTFSKSGYQPIMNFKQSVFKTDELRNGHNAGWSSAFIYLRNHIDTPK